MKRSSASICPASSRSDSLCVWDSMLAKSREIVGVVGDTVYRSPREGMVATMYVPVAQQAPETFWPTVLLTINAAPGRRVAVERDVAAAMTRVDPTVAFTFGTFDQLVEATVTQERLIAMLSVFFGGLALLLAAVGLYGVVAHAVRARQTEIGLRMALGAAPSSIVRLVFRHVGVLDRGWPRVGPGGQSLGRAFRGGAAISRGGARPGDARRIGCSAHRRGRPRRLGAGPSRLTARSGNGASRGIGRLCVDPPTPFAAPASG